MVVRERCRYLLELARETWTKDAALARRYVALARRVAMRHRFKLGRRMFCKKCNAPFIAGETLRIRVSSKEKRVVWKCLPCGEVMRFPLRKG